MWIIVFVAQYVASMFMCSGIRSVFLIDSDNNWFGMFENSGLRAVAECRASLKLKKCLIRKFSECYIEKLTYSYVRCLTSILTYAPNLRQEDFHPELNVSTTRCFSSRDSGPLPDLFQYEWSIEIYWKRYTSHDLPKAKILLCEISKSSILTCFLSALNRCPIACPPSLLNATLSRSKELFSSSDRHSGTIPASSILLSVKSRTLSV